MKHLGKKRVNNKSTTITRSGTSSTSPDLGSDQTLRLKVKATEKQRQLLSFIGEELLYVVDASCCKLVNENKGLYTHTHTHVHICKVFHVVKSLKPGHPKHTHINDFCIKY